MIAKRKTQKKPTEQLKAKVIRFRFGPKPGTGWSIIEVVADTSLLPQTFVGCVTNLRIGDEAIFTGHWEEDAQYGQQFKFESYEVQMPSTKAGIVSYLQSSCFGVGRVKAGEIYDTLGENCLDIIQQKGPEALHQVKSIKPDQAQEIYEHLMANQVVAELSSLICGEGVTPNLVHKIYNTYGNDSVSQIKENPYRMADDIHGVGFKISDNVGYKVGILSNNPHRVEAAIMYVLKEAQSDGHCYLKPSDIVKRIMSKQVCGANSGIEVKDIAEANKRLIEGGKCVREGDCIYPAEMYEAEVNLANRMRALLGMPKKNILDLDNKIENCAKSIGVKLATEQHQGIKMALTEPLSIITGGAGVGKSTVTEVIENIYREENPGKPVYKVAPTGKAAKRINGKTMHRELKYHPENGFMHNELNPLEPGLIIADELSMSGLLLSKDFFNALPNDMQVVMVGDFFQLPSVDAGSVLRDCILSGIIPTTFLEYNFRQANGSKIAEFANLVKKGLLFPLEEQFSDWVNTCVDCDDGSDPFELAASMAKEKVIWALKEGYCSMDMQTLVPMRKGSCGVYALNEMAREIINPATDRNKTNCKFRLGDKVMVVANDYKKMVFNGDIGIVVGEGRDIPAGGSRECDGIYIDIDGAEVFFPYNDLDIVELAYAGTIHKSQGSQFPLVIMPVVTQHWIMLQRNLGYTGWTRAQGRIENIYQHKALKQMIDNDIIADRFSRLKERLQGEN